MHLYKIMYHLHVETERKKWVHTIQTLYMYILTHTNNYMDIYEIIDHLHVETEMNEQVNT